MVGMIMIEDGVTNIINTDIMIVMAGMTEGDITIILGEEDGIEIEDPTMATIGIIGLAIPTDHTMTDRIMVDTHGGPLVANCNRIGKPVDFLLCEGGNGCT